MKKIVIVFCFVSTSLFCMNPATVGALAGASLGAAFGASAGTFIVMDKASNNPAFLFKSKEEKVAALVENGAAFTVVGYTACGAAAGAFVGTVEGAVAAGALGVVKYAARDIKENGVKSGTFIIGGLAAASVLAVKMFSDKNSTASQLRRSSSADYLS
jgi:hypothetical protein